MELEPDRELSNEQKMEKNTITRESNNMKIDGTLENSMSDVEKDKKEELVTNSNHNSLLLQNINCRICLAVDEASGVDPIIQLGCQCKDDISFGHESCLKKWFVRRLLRSGFLDCELCRSPLGVHLEATVRSNFPEVIAFQMQGVTRVLLMLRVPPNELDHLQVPHDDIPDFYELPPETRRALEASLGRQEQMYRHNENRRSANFSMAQNIVVQGEGPLRANQLPARILQAAELRDHFFFGTTPYRDTDDDNSEDRDTYDDNSEERNTDDDNSEDQNTNDDNSEDRDTNDDNNDNRDTYDDNNEDGDTYDDNNEDRDTYDDNNEDRDTNDGNMNLEAIWEEPIVRVAIEGLSTTQQVEELLDEISLYIDMFAEVAQENSEDMIFLPRSMLSQQDPMLNTIAPRPLAQHAILAPRQYTYGRFQFFLLHDIV